MAKKKGSKKRKIKKPLAESSDRGFIFRHWLTSDVLYIVLLALLICAIHPGLVFEGKRYAVDDNVVKAITAHNVKSDDGSTTHWDPKSWGGIPNVFHLSRSAISPDYYLEKLSDYLSLAFVYLLFGAIGMFFLLRWLDMSRLIAALGASIFVLAPYLKSLVIVGHIDKFPALMFVPWIAWFVLRLRRDQNLLNVLLLGGMIGMQLRANHYQVVFYTGFLVIFLFAPLILKLIKEKAFVGLLKPMASLSVSYGIGILLAAQPLLVTYELAGNTLRAGSSLNINTGSRTGDRGVDKSFVKTWSWQARDLLSLSLPRGVGGLTIEKYTGTVPGYIDGVSPGYWGAVPFTRSYYYVGAVVFLLCCIGLLGYKSKPIVLSLGLLCLLMLGWAFGVNSGIFYDLCYDYLPFFKNFRTPLTSLSLCYFGSAVLAGYGVKYIVTEPIQAKKRIIKQAIIGTVGVGVLLGCLYFVLPFFKQGEDLNVEIRDLVIDIRRRFYLTDLIKYFVLIGLAGGIILLYLKEQIRSNLFVTVLCILVLIDFLWVLGQHRTHPTTYDQFQNEHFVRSPLVTHLEQDTDIFRILANTQRDQSLSYFFHSLDRSTDLQMSRLMYEIVSNNLFRNIDGQLNVNWNILDIMNVKYVVTERTLDHPKLVLEISDPLRKVNLYRYKFNRPRGFFVNRHVIVSDPKERLEWINRGSVDFNQLAILEKQPLQQLGSAPSWKSELRAYEGDYMRFDLQTNQHALFVISELYNPDLQEIFLDGQKVDDVYKTNHAVLSVVIPPGTHTLELSYSDKLFTTSATISKYSFLFLYLLIFSLYLPRVRKWIENRKSVT